MTNVASTRSRSEILRATCTAPKPATGTVATRWSSPLIVEREVRSLPLLAASSISEGLIGMMFDGDVSMIKPFVSKH